MRPSSLGLTLMTLLLSASTLPAWAGEMAANTPEHLAHKYRLPKLAPARPGGPEARLQVPKGAHIEEFKADGQVYMVKVIPPKPFPPYYMVNKDGKGQFTRVPNTDAERMSVPQWILLRW